jgi:hypothetical protein
MRACRDAAMEGKACRFGQPAIIAFLGVSRYRLQRERLPAPMWADRDPVGNRMTY